MVSVWRGSANGCRCPTLRCLTARPSIWSLTSIRRPFRMLPNGNTHVIWQASLLQTSYKTQFDLACNDSWKSAALSKLPVSPTVARRRRQRHRRGGWVLRPFSTGPRLMPAVLPTDVEHHLRPRWTPEHKRTCFAWLTKLRGQCKSALLRPEKVVASVQHTRQNSVLAWAS